MANPEHYIGSHERSEVERAAAERATELREHDKNRSEKQESNAEHEAHEARSTAEHEAKSTKEYRPAPPEGKKPVIDFAGTLNREKSYEQTMQTVQKELSAPSRAFSKVIHNNVVEKLSDAGSSTIARPNAILAGSICAFILVLAVYLIARYVGFALSGFETIAAFIIGWIIGIVFDFLRVMINGRR